MNDVTAIVAAVEELPFVTPQCTVVDKHSTDSVSIGYRPRTDRASDAENRRIVEHVAERLGIRVSHVRPLPSTPSGQIQVLQAIRLKGRPAVADIVSATGLPPLTVEQILQYLMDKESCVSIGECYGLTPTGRDQLRALIVEERSRVDRRLANDAYQRFDEYNTLLKAVVTDWQLKDGAAANDHTDAGYDAAVLDRLADLHERFQPLLGELVCVVSRLAPYPGRFAAAMEKVRGGDHAWVARPLIDSYHTVWFELHEELIGLTGRKRIHEAVAGRAG
ncbi:hypothetical protein [Frankia gtarii]|uniref:hypothetical protein n=1 Tax=Frankia gtarii TaxID=2950102 RepID=UPI0021C19E43|nr:hypothetical protein [Frankia gtarii]